MKENKGYVLHFLEETEEIKIICEPWDQVKARTRPPQEAEIHPGEELKATTKTEWVQAGGGVEADLGATVRRTARNEEANTPRKTWDEGDSQSVDHTSTSRHGEE